MLTDWLRVAERIAKALERMADAAEARNRADGIKEKLDASQGNG